MPGGSTSPTKRPRRDPLVHLPVRLSYRGAHRRSAGAGAFRAHAVADGLCDHGRDSWPSPIIATLMAPDTPRTAPKVSKVRFAGRVRSTRNARRGACDSRDRLGVGHLDGRQLHGHHVERRGRPGHRQAAFGRRLHQGLRVRGSSSRRSSCPRSSRRCSTGCRNGANTSFGPMIRL